MTDLGITDFSFRIDRCDGAFRYSLTFSLLHTRRTYTEVGAAASPEQCFDAAMSYVALIVREVVA